MLVDGIGANGMSERTLRGALVGCGFFGGIQMEAWRRMPDVEIVAACDPALERARQFAPRAWTSIEEMLDREELDFVDIATRPESHLELMKIVAARRLPVICQKPLAPSWKEALAIGAVVKETGVRAMVHENWRWQPWYREAKQRIANGDIGNPVTYTFRTRKRDGVGPEPYTAQPYFREMPRLLVYETLIHHLDTARFLFGDLQGITAKLRRHNGIIRGEDQGLILAEHDRGMVGVVDGHRFLEPDSPVMGDALFEGDETYLRIVPRGDVYLGQERVWEYREAGGYRGDSVRATQQHFVDCLRSGEPFETGVSDYLQSFAATEAAYRSAEQGRTVTIQEVTG